MICGKTKLKASCEKKRIGIDRESLTVDVIVFAFDFDFDSNMTLLG